MAFVLIEYVLSGAFAALSPYSVYIFEFIFVFCSWIFFRKQIGFKFSLSASRVRDAALLFAAGFAVFYGSVALALLNPIDVRDSSTRFFLLAYAPVVEELIFRMGLWGALIKLTEQKKVAWIVSSLLFSFSHFYSYFFVDDALKGFIVYQTIYTFALALFLGWTLIRFNSILLCILLHFLFNLGFAGGVWIHGTN